MEEGARSIYWRIGDRERGWAAVGAVCKEYKEYQALRDVHIYRKVKLKRCLLS